MCFTESEWLFFIQWFVAIEARHYFTRYRLEKFSSSSLDYNIILKRHKSLRHESSFARWISHERFVILAKSLLSPQNTKTEDRNSLSYKYMAKWKALGWGLPCYIRAKNIAWHFPPLPADVALGLGGSVMRGVSRLFWFFLCDLCKCDGAGNNPSPTCPTIWLYCQKVRADNGLETFPLLLAPPPFCPLV